MASGLDRLKRVMWRVRSENPKEERLTWDKLKIAVIKECGYSPGNYFNVKKALLKIGWITRHRKQKFNLTGKDITEEF